MPPPQPDAETPPPQPDAETPPPQPDAETICPAEDAPSKPSDGNAATGDASERSPAIDAFAAAVADRAQSAAAWLWRHARRLALHGTAATRPLEIALRAMGLVVAGFAPLWPLFGSLPDGWWDWLLTTLANVGIGLVLFGAGETVRKINEVHSAVVERPDHDDKEARP